MSWLTFHIGGIAVKRLVYEELDHYLLLFRRWLGISISM